MSQIRNRPGVNSNTNEIYTILINTLKSDAKLQKGQEAIYEKLIQSKFTDPRPKDSSIDWAELEAHLEKTYGNRKTLKIPPLEEDMTSLIQFIEKADFEEDEEAQKWIGKFVACNNLGPQIIRKSERPKPVPLVPQEISSAKEIPSSKEEKMKSNSIDVPKKRAMATSQNETSKKRLITSMTPEQIAAWKVRFESAFKKLYYQGSDSNDKG